MLTHKGTCEIQTPRLRLRKYTLADAGDMFKNYAADIRVTQFLCWPPYQNTEDVRLFLQGAIKAYEQNNTYSWAIEYQNQMVGSISVTALDEGNQSCEIGYCVGFDYWNKGLVSEAMNAVLGFLFNQVNMRRVIAKHDAENPASGKVMEKCGMVYEGRLRKHYLRNDGTAGDALLYGILRQEFTPR